MVKIIKEVHIQNEQTILMPKCGFFINGIEQKEKSINPDTDIIVKTEEEADEIALRLIEDLAKKTWPNKNIIRYEKLDSQINMEKKYEKQPINFKILSWIREN